MTDSNSQKGVTAHTSTTALQALDESQAALELMNSLLSLLVDRGLIDSTDRVSLLSEAIERADKVGCDDTVRARLESMRIGAQPIGVTH